MADGVPHFFQDLLIFRVSARNLALIIFWETIVNIELIFRIIGMIILGAFGAYWGIQLAELFDLSLLLGSIILGLVGAVVGFLFTPYVTTRPAKTIRNNLGSVSTQTLVAGLIGLVAGLIIAALSAYPLSLLPSPFGAVFPFLALLIFGYFGIFRAE